jgi:hypothetical protein
MIIWRNVEAELLCFSWFSTDYWMSDLVHPAEKSKDLRLAFYNHCQNIFNSSEERSALKERMNSYGQLVISNLSDEILYIRFGEMLAEYCGQPEPSFYFILVAPELFNQARTGVSEIT